ncbi:MAG: 2-hydroxyglutaryl-CoA dehydratase [Lachnospiraceae bacterium]|nr:2-hydroxyglutaryl-CoA dehydratase [Lachnospiraceae bacterium]
MKIGLDVGSTTIKSIVLDGLGNIVYSAYERHFSQITAKTVEALEKIRARFPGKEETSLVISGSAGMGMAESCSIDFVQEVYATKVAAQENAPGTDVIIELGGEDAKIIYLQGAMEARMNGSCAGGTGAFIDQMATLLGITPDDMNDLAAESTKQYTIASRCGVFAKSDIQPLINQGADRRDISASIFSAVVNQTIGGLAQGRAIEGNVLYLGGPLTFMPELRKSFDKALRLEGTCPDNSLYYVALGAALCAKTAVDLDQVIARLSEYESVNDFDTLPPLFGSEDEYQEFCARHAQADVTYGNLEGYTGQAWLGIDAGSTTVKAVVIGEDKEILDSTYLSNSGNPVPIVRDYLTGMYRKNPGIRLAGACVTGYGEDIIRNAFSLDYGLVETMAHLKAAQEFMPDVEFIIDIGGQDMKCFKIHNSAIDNIYLNEACSSGCGSFLQTFAGALNYSAEEFAKLGLFSKNAVDLGSRCTVFMNSSVKQAQKDGVSTEDISAGLSISVVKNAIYKVIRPASVEELGRRIVVQGGTFLNDAVLRAFERELGLHVVRPVIAGLMGAYGCALHAMGQKGEKSRIVTSRELEDFAHEVKNVNCGLCSNRCLLSVNTFSGGRKYIAGNKCERPVTKRTSDADHNIYKYKQELLAGYRPVKGTRAETIGIPMGLNMYELVPFWHRFFSELGFGVVVSPFSTRELYLDGQHSIPSDTVCFPAKMLHGHVEYLKEQQVDAVFYPCMSFNFDEGLGDNNYNCPVVAYYPEVIAANMKFPGKTRLVSDYVGPHKRKFFPEKMTELLGRYFEGVDIKAVKHASDLAFKERDLFLARVRAKAEEIVALARREGRRIIVLAGRPYHVDPEINHGIDMLINGFGVSVISEDAVSHKVSRFPVKVLNQWMYHSRLYAAAKYVCTQEDMDIVQLVSFGCGLDAITTDEVRRIVEGAGKIYTQIKIDEITNLGAVRVRLRSLLAALEQQEARQGS